MQAITLHSGLERKTYLSRTLAAFKLSLRAMVYPQLTNSWLDLLNSHSVMRELAHA